MTRTLRSLRLLAGLGALSALLGTVGPLREHAMSHVAGFLPTWTNAPVEAAFTRATPSGPLVWSPCATVRVLVNPGPFGEEAADEIRGAFAEVAAITGLRFVFSSSDLVPSGNWAHALGPWDVPPVLVAWTDPASTDMIGPAAAGAATANPSTGRDGRRRIVTGAIALDAGEYASYRAGDGAGRTRRNLILHEIGHLLGLDHVDGAGLMDPVVDASSPDGFHPQEVAALRSAYGPSRCGR